MANDVSFVVEAISILLCINRLYGKKFQLDIWAIIMIAADFILLQLINEGILSNGLSIIIYLLLIGYCILEFGFNKKELIINYIMNIMIISVLQMCSWMLLDTIHLTSQNSADAERNSLMVNCVTLLMIFLISMKERLHKMAVFMQQKLAIIRILLIIGTLLIGYLLIVQKLNGKLRPEHYIVIIISMCMLGIVTYLWQKTHNKVREQKMELLMHQLYDEDYNELITSIRRKQHDFGNHLNTIQGMSAVYDNYEELVENQSDYIVSLKEENKYSRLLSLGNPVIVGFLYSKFLQAEQRKIRVEYEFHAPNMKCQIPDHKLVEIIGNLIDNAMDAVEQNPVEKVIYVKIENRDEDILFCIHNECQHLTQADIERMFVKGVSSKGENRGLGLVNVKAVCEEYQCDLEVGNQKEEDKNYIQFTVHLKK
ncbi:MAG: GHKL domain-containing protein [Lachnospiraceae bacterium]|nr:GHKL domain-containing protein [Lachnospiraceae bacterium]